nr:hypothetical protein [Hyphomonas sp. Mor2]
MTTIVEELETYPFVLDREAIIKGMGAFGWRLAKSSEHTEMMALAEELLGSQLTSAETIAWINSVTGSTSWVCGDPIDGIFIIVPVSPEGLRAIQTGEFDPSGPNKEHLAALGQTCAGVYVGAYAGANHQARKNVMMATVTMRVEGYGQVPAFARGATEDGVRSMVSIGFKPAGFGADKLWMQPPVRRPEKDAA